MNANEILKEVLKSPKLKASLGVPFDKEINPQSGNKVIDIIRRIINNDTGGDNLFNEVKRIAGV